MTLIVTMPKGGIKENVVRLHTDRNEAAFYGKLVYGFGKFKIQNYSTWKKTKQAKFEITRIKTLERIRRYK